MGAMILDGVWTVILGEVQAMLRCMAEAEEEMMTSAGVMAHTEHLEKTEGSTGAGVVRETAAQLEAATESSSTVGGSETTTH